MKSTTLKRIATIILALCLTLSSAPLAFAELPDSGVKITYDIAAQIPGWGDTTPFADFTYEATNGFWEYAANSGNYTTQQITGNFLRYRGDGISLRPGVWWAVKLYVPTTGKYVPSVAYSSYNNAIDTEVYLFKNNGSAVTTAQLTAANQIGKFSCTGVDAAPSDNFAETATLSPVELEYGEYYLVYRGDTAVASGEWRYALAGNFTLNGGDGAAAMNISVALADSIETGDSKTATVSGYMSDATTAAVTGATFSSSAPAIASVDSDTGVVTAHTAGEATITASYRGLSAEKTVTVVYVPYSGIKVKYDIAAQIPGWGDTTPLANFTYEATNGFWEYAANSGNYTTQETSGNRLRYRTNGISLRPGIWWAVKLYVPVSGKYVPSVAYSSYNDAIDTEVHLFKNDGSAVTTAQLTEANKIGKFSCTSVASAPSDDFAETATLSPVKLDAGEYYLVYRGDTTVASGEWRYAMAGNFTLNGGDGAALIGSITSGADALTAGESTAVTASGYNSATATAATLSYASSDTSVAAVNASTGAVTAVGAGTADILATADGITVPLKTSVTVSDAAATATADVLVTAANASSGGSAVSANITASGTDSLVKGMRAAQNVGTRITVTADAEADGATFKYWQNHTTKKVVSSERSFEFTVGSNVMLVAVYSKAPEAGKYAVDFLNANGAVIQSTYVNSGATIGSITKPATPTMTGYTFTGWNAEDAEVIDGDTYVMAEYEPVGITASINVNGTSNSYAFNAEVEATSDDADFSYWTRNGKIISYSPTYKFYAWKDAEVTAVCNGAVTKTPRVLLDGAPIGAAVMMEYEVPTGFTKVEAGIIYGGSNVTLANYTSKAISGSDAAHGQFTALPNGGSSARAYLIYNNGTENKIVYSNIVWLT